MNFILNEYIYTKHHKLLKNLIKFYDNQKQISKECKKIFNSYKCSGEFLNIVYEKGNIYQINIIYNQDNLSDTSKNFIYYCNFLSQDFTNIPPFNPFKTHILDEINGVLRSCFYLFDNLKISFKKSGNEIFIFLSNRYINSQSKE